MQNGQCFLRPYKEAGLSRILAAFKLRTLISRVISGRVLPATVQERILVYGTASLIRTMHTVELRRIVSVACYLFQLPSTYLCCL